MTNWDRIRKVVNVNKDYIINNCGICEGHNGELIPVNCNFINCDKCIFDLGNDCREQTVEFLEKEVTINE